MRKSKLLWVGPVTETQLFESISLLYEEIHLLGEPSYALTELSEECVSKLVVENSVIESGSEARYFESQVLESVSYFDDVVFSGKKVPMHPINTEKKIYIEKYLSNLQISSISSIDVFLANPLMPMQFFKKVFQKLNLLNCESLYLLSDSRIKSEFLINSEELCHLLESNSFLKKKTINLGKRKVNEFRLSYINEKKKLEKEIYNLKQNLTNLKIKEVESEKIKAELTKSISLLENEKTTLLSENEKLATEIISLQTSLEMIARENHHILIELSQK